MSQTGQYEITYEHKCSIRKNIENGRALAQLAHQLLHNFDAENTKIWVNKNYYHKNRIQEMIQIEKNIKKRRTVNQIQRI